MKPRYWVIPAAIIAITALLMNFSAKASYSLRGAILASEQGEKPVPLFKIRAITAFVSIDPGQVEEAVSGTVQFLERARDRFQAAGFEVQTIRLATQPFPDYTKNMSHRAALELIQKLDRLAVQHHLDLSIGPGILEDRDDPEVVALITDILSHTKTTNASVTVATPERGVQPKAVRAAAQIMKSLSTASKGGIGNFSFAAAANCPAGIPFFPTAYHRGTQKQFALAIQSASLVQEAFAHSLTPAEARANLKKIYETQLHPVEAIAQGLSEETRWNYEGMDVSTAPLKDVSIGAAIEALSGVPFGDHGTLTVAAMITDVLKSLNLRRTGYSGLMIPVMEDATIARRAAEGRLSLDKLLLFSSVCATGIDVAPIPGDTPSNEIERVILDVASQSTKLKKPLAVRLLVVPGKQQGAMTDFEDPFLVNTKVMSVK
ncbi:MAG: DUF711 family protein [Acidobacteriia bacterium]|nr:DUF711 family protein [Terriglobia bacterium]